ncbi:MAG: hypothetical protein K8H88_12850, partial [Sandaracinaceae bacterium]|nr:hypothetical protein [Sandaracinaceae bacterium]
MGSPAPHTPVNFLKAGGGSFFSARCQKAIQDLGWDPDEFGDYDHTLSYIQKCRERVAAGDPTLTPRQRELGQPYYVPGSNPLQVNPNAFTSGHMYFNSTMQERGRGNDCTSRVDGYSMGGCPAMPHQGQTTDPGTQHNRHTVREYAGALNPDGTRTPGALYGGAATPAEATARAHADAEARARELVRERREQLGATSGT